MTPMTLALILAAVFLFVDLSFDVFGSRTQKGWSRYVEVCKTAEVPVWGMPASAVFSYFFLVFLFSL